MGVAPPAHYIQQLRSSLLSVSLYQIFLFQILLLVQQVDKVLSNEPTVDSTSWDDRGAAHDVRNLLQ